MFLELRPAWEILPYGSRTPEYLPIRQMNWKDRVECIPFEKILEEALEPCDMEWDLETSKRWQCASACLIAGYMADRYGTRLKSLDAVVSASFEYLEAVSKSEYNFCSHSAISPCQVGPNLLLNPDEWEELWPKVMVCWSGAEDMRFGEVFFYAYELLMNGCSFSSVTPSP